MYYRLVKPCFISTQSCDRVVDLLFLVIKIKHLSGLHFPALPAAFPALIATGHFAFGYVLLLPFPLLNSVLSNGLKSDCIYARTVTDMEDHKAAIKYSGKWRLWEVVEVPVILNDGQGPGLGPFHGSKMGACFTVKTYTSSTGHSRAPDHNFNIQLKENTEEVTGKSLPDISWSGKLRSCVWQQLHKSENCLILSPVTQDSKSIKHCFFQLNWTNGK